MSFVSVVTIISSLTEGFGVLTVIFLLLILSSANNSFIFSSEIPGIPLIVWPVLASTDRFAEVGIKLPSLSSFKNLNCAVFLRETFFNGSCVFVVGEKKDDSNSRDGKTLN